jgi:hypothetical protein
LNEVQGAVQKFANILQNVESCILTVPSAAWSVAVATTGKKHGCLNVSPSRTYWFQWFETVQAQ